MDTGGSEVGDNVRVDGDGCGYDGNDSDGEGADGNVMMARLKVRKVAAPKNLSQVSAGKG